METSAPPSQVADAFVLQLGRALHASGYPAHRLEHVLSRVSRRLGRRGQFFSTPTALFASFGEEDDQRTFQVRVEPGDVDLQRLSRLHALAARVASGEVSPREGGPQVEAIRAEPAPYGTVLTTAAFAFSSGAAARFFGGGLREVLAATAIGLTIGTLALVVRHVRGSGRVFEPTAAALAALLAVLWAAVVPPLSVYTAVLAGLIVLLPGFSLTVAMIELATRNLVSGTARMAGALGTFVAIGFGVALGTRVGERLVGPPPEAAVRALPAWTEWVALLVAPLGFSVLLRAERRDAPWIVSAGLVAWAGARGGSLLLGPELGVFLGALAVGLHGNAFSRLLGRPSVVPLVPGMLLLVPGSVGFLSLSSLLHRETLVGVEAAFRMALGAVSLATGLLFANVVLPPRALADPGGEEEGEP